VNDGLFFVLGVIATALLAIPVFGAVQRLTMHRVDGGRFKVLHRNDGTPFGVDTSLGVLRVLRGKRLVRWSGQRGSDLSFPFEEVVGAGYKPVGEPADMEEMTMGFNVWDLFKEYRDYYLKIIVSLQLADGTELPVFAPKQYQHRKLGLTWYFESEREFLVSRGWARNVEDLARKAHHAIEQLLT